MLTQEQIKNLKKGQEVYIKANFLEIGKSMNESLYVHINRTDGLGYGFEISGQSCNIPIEDIVIPSSPKYDPCRLFKTGDVVEYRPKDGRANPNLLVGRRYKVSVDEPCDSGIVQVECDGLRHIDTFVAYNNLELVTPVEEQMPFSVEEINVDSLIYNPKLDPCRDSETAFHVKYTDKHSGEIIIVKTYYESNIYPYACARADAEAERDRLNAVYGKEQNND